jgi:hypothetical protein
MLQLGQPVDLSLTKEHNLPRYGEQGVLHAGKILFVHPGGEWADVELEEAHAGGRKFISAPVGCITERSEK